MQTQTTVNKYNTARVWLPTPWYHLLPFVLLLTMAGATFFLSAVLPLRGLGYSDAPLPRVGSWILWPTHVFFPNHAVITSQPVSSRDTALPSLAGTITRTLSLLMFAVAYGVLCWKTIASRDSLLTPLHLVRWMVLAWLLYCALGSPWFWPWYTVTFFGLLVLIASVRVKNTQELPFFTALRSPLTISLFTFSMLSLYCFFTLGPVSSAIPWLPPFRWTDLRGLWAWLIPPLVFCLGSKGNI